MSNSVPTTYLNATGKTNAIRSVCQWIYDEIPPDTGWTYYRAADPKAFVTPFLVIDEFVSPSVGSNAIDDRIDTAKIGRLDSFWLQFDIHHDAAKSPSAKPMIEKMRDRLIRGLTLAGKYDDATDTVPIPPIACHDYDHGVDTNTYIRVPTEEGGFKIERYFPPTAETPALHRIQILMKFVWYELN